MDDRSLTRRRAPVSGLAVVTLAVLLGLDTRGSLVAQPNPPNSGCDYDPIFSFYYDQGELEWINTDEECKSQFSYGDVLHQCPQNTGSCEACGECCHQKGHYNARCDCSVALLLHWLNRGFVSWATDPVVDGAMEACQTAAGLAAEGCLDSCRGQFEQAPDCREDFDDHGVMWGVDNDW